MKHRYLKPAKTDLDDAMKYYESCRAGLGIEFASEVANAIKQIGRMPLIWQEIETGIRKYRVRRFPYSIVYAALVQEIVIISVAHQKRDQEFWKGRY